MVGIVHVSRLLSVPIQPVCAEQGRQYNPSPIYPQQKQCCLLSQLRLIYLKVLNGKHEDTALYKVLLSSNCRFDLTRTALLPFKVQDVTSLIILTANRNINFNHNFENNKRLKTNRMINFIVCDSASWILQFLSMLAYSCFQPVVTAQIRQTHLPGQFHLQRKMFLCIIFTPLFKTCSPDSQKPAKGKLFPALMTDTMGLSRVL